GNGVEFEDQPTFCAGAAGLGFARRAIGGAGEVKIAIAAAPPFADDDFGAVGGEVAEHVAARAVVNDGARRHGNDEIGAVLAVAVGGAAAFAALRSPEFAINEGSEAVGIGVGAEDDAADAAAAAA